MSKRKRSRIYFQQLLGATAALLLLAVGLAVAIDPYALYDRVLVSGFNQVKPQTGTHKWLAKEGRARRLEPATVLMGNSRVDVGFDPDSPLWPDEWRPVFNYGIPGQGMKGVVRIYDTLIRDASPDNLVVGLDFMDFLDTRALAPGYALPLPEELRAAPMSARKLVETHLSQSALLDSVLTLLAQGNPNASTMTIKGFSPLRSYNALVRSEGHHAIADQRNRENLDSYSHYPRSIYLADGSKAAPLQLLELLLADAQRRGIEVKLFIYPYHADLLETIAVSGHWPMFEEWKRAVLKAAEQADDGSGQIELWDFADYSELTIEPIPGAGDRKTKMNWYWEPGHFKAALGEEIVATLLGEGREGFGTKLESATLEPYLDAVRERRARYHEERPGDVARLAKLCQRINCAE